MTHPAHHAEAEGGSKPSDMISVTLKFNRSNMESLLGMIEMYGDSEERQFARISNIACRRIDRALTARSVSAPAKE